MKCKQNIHNAITRHMGMLPVLLAAVIALVLAVSVPAAWAKRDVIEYDEAEIFFELNDTDGDLGIHALIDGDAWRYLRIVDPRHRQMLNIIVKGHLRKQGLTEIFFESAEPTFDELDPKDFFSRFPEGEYKIKGKTLNRDKVVSKVDLTHVMPAPPEPTVNGWSMAENCDEGATVVRSLPVTIEWPEVTWSHPDFYGGGAGVQPPIPVTIHNYEVVLEIELGEEFTSVLRGQQFITSQLYV